MTSNLLSTPPKANRSKAPRGITSSNLSPPTLFYVSSKIPSYHTSNANAALPRLDEPSFRTPPTLHPDWNSGPLASSSPITMRKNKKTKTPILKPESRIHKQGQARLRSRKNGCNAKRRLINEVKRSLFLEPNDFSPSIEPLRLSFSDVLLSSEK